MVRPRLVAIARRLVAIARCLVMSAHGVIAGLLGAIGSSAPQEPHVSTSVASPQAGHSTAFAITCS